MKLLNFQIPHAMQLKESLKVSKCVIDASDTGTGKTYVTISICKDLKLKPFIICPKSVVPNWIDVAKKFDVNIFGIANYEMIKNCKYYTEKYEKTVCPYMDLITQKNNKNGKEESSIQYKFMLPNDVLIVFDEAHRCKNHQSSTSKLLRGMNKTSNKIILLSATITDKIDCFKPFGEVFGFYNDVKEYKMWMRKNIYAEQIYHKAQNIIADDEKVLDIINRKIFPQHGSRMRIKELGDLFPQNQICYQAYLSENKNEIQEQYMIIQQAFDDLKDKEAKSDALARIIRARMKIEMFKIPIMIDVIMDALESKYSVAVFVNYIGTLEFLAHYFETSCLIHGKQTLEERQDSIQKFQTNNSPIIISIIQAGGVGISLHDELGGHPRMSIISPTWSGQDMVQVLGRIHRAGSKSHAIQKIIYCDETYENRICQIINEKIKNITSINDHNFNGIDIPDELYEETKSNSSSVNNIVLEPDDDNDETYKRILKKEKRKKFNKLP